jgi:hypothetical protein
MKTGPVRLPRPDLQIDFAATLCEVRGEYLLEALSKTVERMEVERVDRELAAMTPKADLAALASRGLRGELVFAVPSVLSTNPKLLGYYRLLLGYSQKAFYQGRLGTTGFKAMEEDGVLSPVAARNLPCLCSQLISAACVLVAGIGMDRVTRNFIDDLTLLTLGPQLRGGANVRKGTAGIVKVFDAIYRIVRKHCRESEPSRMVLRNAAKRKVTIEFAADPDIVIRELMPPAEFRNIVAIEIKGGTDFSNIHNRLGEAEKSHQKARLQGFVECWTVVNVDNIDLEMARKESPSTDRFYPLSDLALGKGDGYMDFKRRVLALTGLPNR